MQRLPLTALRVAPIVAACAASIQDSDLKKRLITATDELSAAETAYISRGPLATLFQIKSTIMAGSVSKDEMTRVYDGTFARRGSLPRSEYYDLIKASAPHKTCPYCSHRTVSMLDHYLPKKLHPQLAVTPVNLVPICGDCNHLKLDFQSDTADKQFIHPYFDEVDDAVWLTAEVVEGAPPGMIFHAQPPLEWADDIRNRVSHHFSVLQLDELYASQAGRLMSGISLRMAELFESGGSLAVSQHLASEAKSRRECGKNSWEVVTYEALGASDFFCKVDNWRSL